MKTQFLILTATTVLVTPLLQQTTPLGDAAERGDLEQVHALLQSDVDVNELHNNGATPLYHAVSHGHVAITRELLQHGANPKIRTNFPGRWTPLHRAASKGYTEVVHLLLQHGAVIDVRDDSFCTPLHIAAEMATPPIIRVLMRWGADPSAAAKHGATPLHLAVSQRMEANVWALITAGSDIDQPDSSYYRTPLQYAIWRYLRYWEYVSDSQKPSRNRTLELLLGVGAEPRWIYNDETEGQRKALRSYWEHYVTPLTQRWAWHVQQALQARIQGTQKELRNDIVQLICQFTSEATPHNDGTPINFLSDEYARYDLIRQCLWQEAAMPDDVQELVIKLAGQHYTARTP